MKTPKRIVPKDFEKAQRCIRGVNCKFNDKNARWKRKNREARLRHALRKYRFIAEQLEHCGKRWDKLVSMYNRDGLRLMETARVYRASGTCGHDIEGS